MLLRCYRPRESVENQNEKKAKLKLGPHWGFQGLAEGSVGITTYRRIKLVWGFEGVPTSY